MKKKKKKEIYKKMKMKIWKIIKYNICIFKGERKKCDVYVIVLIYNKK